MKLIILPKIECKYISHIDINTVYNYVVKSNKSQKFIPSKNYGCHFSTIHISYRDGYLSCQTHILARTPMTRHLQLCLSFWLGSTTGNCSLPSWQPNDDWLHPAWLLSGCKLGDCHLYTSQRLTCTSICDIF